MNHVFVFYTKEVSAIIAFWWHDILTLEKDSTEGEPDRLSLYTAGSFHVSGRSLLYPTLPLGNETKKTVKHITLRAVVLKDVLFAFRQLRNITFATGSNCADMKVDDVKQEIYWGNNNYRYYAMCFIDCLAKSIDPDFSQCPTCTLIKWWFFHSTSETHHAKCINCPRNVCRCNIHIAIVFVAQLRHSNIS